jgi:hypothetical protein
MPIDQVMPLAELHKVPEAEAQHAPNDHTKNDLV